MNLSAAQQFVQRQLINTASKIVGFMSDNPLTGKEVPVTGKDAQKFVKAYVDLGGDPTTAINVTDTGFTLPGSQVDFNLKTTPTNLINKFIQDDIDITRASGFEGITERPDLLLSGAKDSFTRFKNVLDTKIPYGQSMYLAKTPTFVENVKKLDPSALDDMPRGGLVYAPPMGVSADKTASEFRVGKNAFGQSVAKISKLGADMEGLTGEIFDLKAPKDFMYGSSVLAHELGHALDYGTPAGKKALDARTDRSLAEDFSNFGTPKSKRLGNVKTKLSRTKGNPVQALLAGIGFVNPNQSLGMQMVEGAVAESLTPDSINTMRTELTADKNAKRIADKAGLKINPKLLTLAKGTYATGPLLKGAASAIPGFFINKAAERYIDPQVDRASAALRPYVQKVDEAIERRTGLSSFADLLKK
tara:strand:+ start:61 stop:1311 length:1251 start_codon:yes stop_codon:yes gene_type:complete